MNGTTNNLHNRADATEKIQKDYINYLLVPVKNMLDDVL